MVYLFYALSALKVWMLVDAWQRGVAPFWYCVIVFMPGGSLVYFFMVKAPDFGIGTGVSRFRPVSGPKIRLDVDQLRYQFQENGCLANEALLASALFDVGEYEEAEAHYRGVLNRDDGYQRALYGLGLCQVRQGDHAAAVETLRRLLDKDRAYADYQAWLELAGALGELGERDKSIECLEGLVAACPRMDHTLALADALIEADRADDARARLERALLDYDHAPRHVQKQHARNAREARQILGKIA